MRNTLVDAATKSVQLGFGLRPLNHGVHLRGQGSGHFHKSFRYLVRLVAAKEMNVQTEPFKSWSTAFQALRMHCGMPTPW